MSSPARRRARRTTIAGLLALAALLLAWTPAASRGPTSITLVATNDF